MSTIAVLAHRDVAHELGHLGDWCESRGHRVERLTREDAPLRGARDAGDLRADALVVLGSPTSVADSWCAAPATAEIEMVRAWVGGGRAYLGICFGAQVLARALGGAVRRMPATVRGYLAMTGRDGGAAAAGAGGADVGAPPHPACAGRWPLWHEDAISAPAGAELLGRLPHADLALRAGAAWGVQPHVEFTAAIVERLGVRVGASRDEWGPIADGIASDATLGARTHALLDAWSADWA